MELIKIMGTYKRMQDRMRKGKRIDYDKLRRLKKLKEDKNQSKIEDFFTKNNKKS
jgi:cell fate (sporulation/competence/biofilm development) regulator YlbF (YheA/YmcA/DUF963 family)